MAVLSVYQHGATSGIPGDNHGMAGKRGVVNGWSHAATKNNIKFLRSVVLSELEQGGIAFTLTLKDCPPSGEVWHQLRRSFVKRLERAGMSKLHWVTEWQKRGVPHLHGVAYFDKPDPRILRHIVLHWCAVAAEFGAVEHAQHVAEISDSLGWLKYLAKHASRGVTHYQRSSQSIPEGWKKTGRVWGHTGDWPLRDAIKIELDKVAFFRFRRMVRAWRISDARQADDLGRLKSARAMLTCSDPVLSELRGVSEWVTQEVTLRMAELLASQGYDVKC